MLVLAESCLLNGDLHWNSAASGNEGANAIDIQNIVDKYAYNRIEFVLT